MMVPTRKSLDHVEQNICSDKEGEFACPTSATFDFEGNLLVLDSDNNRVQVFDGEGNFKFFWGSQGEKDGQLRDPVSIAIDRNGNVWITDTKNDRIQSFTPSGKWLKTIGGAKEPVGLAIDLKGNLIITENDPHQVRVISPEGETIRIIGNSGTENGAFLYPSAVLVDRLGRVLVSDSRIQMFTEEGEFIKVIGADLPAKALAIDPEGNLICCDVSNHRIVIFQ